MVWGPLRAGADPSQMRAGRVPLQLEERRDSMLETARQCFAAAARCEGDGDEEEWLIHYMLGKVAEKQQQPPTVYLRHYCQASHLLHEEAARYPKKIHYHNPPELAMEALEVRPRMAGGHPRTGGGPGRPPLASGAGTGGYPRPRGAAHAVALS